MKTKTFTMPQILKDQLFAKICQVMEEDEISQGEVARRLGVARPNINKLIRGKDIASIDLLLKIAESIDLNVELIMEKKSGTSHRRSNPTTAGKRKETRT